MQERKDYYLGFDIGTNSVGWAVTDESYQLQRFHGKLMWGSRLFDEAQTAQARREARTTRRRLQRRRWRIELLQELFAEEISKKDMGFYQRLKDGALFPEDKSICQKNTLFNDEGYQDAQYYQQYKTIYHLRKALITETDKKDIRLVYLALHNILKHRGHFLFVGKVDRAISFECAYDQMVQCVKDEFDITLICNDVTELSNVIRDKRMTKRDKKNRVKELLYCAESDKQKQWVEMAGLICGNTVNLAVMFSEESLKEEEKNKLCFATDSYDEVRPILEDMLQERVGIIDTFKGVYDWGILADILQGGEFEGNSYLSIAKVKAYEKHQEDLKKLKKVIRDYDVNVYRQFFQKPGADNYCAYVGSTLLNGKKIQQKKCDYDELKKAVEKIFKLIPEEENRELRKEILSELNVGTFLPLQVSKDNGVIPHQVHEMELRAILENAAKHYDFLLSTDERGISVKDKIIQLFKFRIPYYVGPLNTYNKNNIWMVRKPGAEGRIYPWNFDEMVDEHKSAENFIRRMTNKCTYLAGKDVVPKNSLLYSEFMVWNELNNVKFRHEKLPVDLKKKIFTELFQTNKRVTGKALRTYLKTEGIQAEVEDLSGFDQNFKSSLSSYLDMKKIFGEEIRKYSVQQMAENLILWSTLYGDAPDMLKQVIRNRYGKEQVSDEQLKKVCRLKYQGWGRLSADFLNGIQGASRETGEKFSILGALRETNDNLMQLLSSNYTFMDEIEALNREQFQHCEVFSYENLMGDLAASPAIKRATWQVVLIAQEVRKIMGKEPLKIFIEMARGPQEKKPTDSRKKRLMQLYANIKEEGRDWKAELENRPESDFRNIKLYLYYTQMGKCMYSGDAIDLSRLADATVYDRDHIYPQSKTKDDSLDNLVLVRRDINSKKSNHVLSDGIQQKMTPFWKGLKEKGLISNEKYYRLTRKTPLTDEELAGFINRQLVETRQSSKVVAELFQRIYQDSEIVYVKAKAVSDFRQEQLKKVKSRSVNDYHHAKDAYLNIVVGNVYHAKFTSNPLHWLKTTKDREYSLNKMFAYPLKKGEQIVWQPGEKGTLQIVRKSLNQRDIRYTRYATENSCGQNGGFWDSQPVSRDKNPEIPLKKGMDVKKYGGYKTKATAYFALVRSFDKKGNMQKSIEAIPLYLKEAIERDTKVFVNYCRQEYGLKEPEILLPRIKKDALLIINGFPMHLRGTTGKQLLLQCAVQLILDEPYERYLKKIERYIQRNSASGNKELLPITEEEGITSEQNCWLYEELYRKQTDTIYQYRPAKQISTLEKGRERFDTLSCEEQCLILNEILHLLQCKPIMANLKAIGGSGQAGKIQINKMIHNVSEAVLIHQSVTGLYEQRVDLLNL